MSFLSKLKAFLEREGITPKKSLSQNFLIDRNVLDKIVHTAQVSSEDSILEIGPGLGAITERLLKQGATLIAVEKDSNFAKLLKDWHHQHLTLYCEDIMNFDLALLPQRTKVVANIPYSLTSAILEKLLPTFPLIESLTLVVQKEWYERLTCPPGSSRYGPLALIQQFYSDFLSSFFVSRNCFYPKPHVDSMVIHLRLKTPPLEKGDEFIKMVKKAFEQRRKSLTSSLQGYATKEELKKFFGDKQVRPQELTLAQFIAIFEKISGE